ncbi:YbaK/EbsC family protein [Rarobacter faecitabidus]
MRPTEPPPGSGLTWERAVDHPELLAEPTRAFLDGWQQRTPQIADLVLVAHINPLVSDTAAMSDAYRIDMHVSVNCVLVSGRREGIERTAAIAVRASTRADINGAVRRLLSVRKASFVPVDRAVTESRMEYGGITPIGLGPQWPLLLEHEVATDEAWIVIGSGVRKSKLALPGTALTDLPDAHAIAGLALK